jgi:hypothetical protein
VALGGMGRVIVFGDTSSLGRGGVRQDAGETVRIASRHPGPDGPQDRRAMEAAVARIDGVVNAVSVYFEHGNHIRIAATVKAGQLWKFSLDDYVIAGDLADKPHADFKRPWGLITAYAQLDGLRIHDLRHTHASIGAGAGLGLPIIGKLLGHRHLETTARASNQIGNAIAAAMDADMPDARVVSFPERKTA